MESLDFHIAETFESIIDEPFNKYSAPDHRELASRILEKVLQLRRLHPSHHACSTSCSVCHAPHISKIISAIESDLPVTFVLPAFPGKSPNLAKVLDPLPDMGERLALLNLEKLCNEIQRIHSPGAYVILCSDGRVFSDIVGMREDDVTNYQDELTRMIDVLGCTHISTFSLDEFSENNDFALVRKDLMEQFGSTPESIRERVLKGSQPQSHGDDVEIHRMYLGITRFLVEDSSFPGQTKSRTAIQKECKAKSIEVIRRSNAWSELIAMKFPEAVRLSIHPQICGSKKIGIRLIENESWMTPWHGVAVKMNDAFVLLKRSEAEALGAHLVFSLEGRPSHFVLSEDASTLFQSEFAT